MRKIQKRLSLLLTVLLAGLSFALLAACGDTNPQNGNLQDDSPAVNSAILKFSDGMLKNCFIDIGDDVRSIGVEKKVNQTVAVNNKNYLVSFDANNQIEQVKFLYQTVDGKFAEFSQEKIEATVSNLYATSKFTYITFSKLGSWRSDNGGFLQESAFVCDSERQSFVIDNKTNKLYPTNEIGIIKGVYENFVCVVANEYSTASVGKYFELSIDAVGNLLARKLIDNDNITGSGVFVDKFGHIFVANSHLDEISGNTIFYTAAYENELHFLGDDGYAYRVETNRIIYYDENLQIKTVPPGREARFGYYLLKNNSLFSVYYDPTWSSPLYCWKVANGLLGAEMLIEYAYWLLVGRDILMYEHSGGQKMLYYFNTATKTIGQMVASANNIEIINDRLLLTTETVSGTKKEEVLLVNGVPTLKLFSDITYPNQIITIQPLN